MLVHCVYFWLRDDLTDEELGTFVEGVNSLTTIDTIRHGFVGTPASTVRPVIDRSYSYSIIAVFDDVDGHDAYQADPVHNKFRDTCASFWTRVKIYDIETSQ